MKKSPLKRGTKTLKRSGFKRKTTPKGRVATKKKLGSSGAKNKPVGGKKKLPSIKTMRNKCDNLLTPIIKLQHPMCFLQGSATCAHYTQVGHHHIKKSNSSALRYNLDNIIPLCNSCHLMLHNNESKWVTILIQKKGMEWANDLLEKNVYVKTDIHFYLENYERLSYEHAKLQSEKPVV